MDDLDLDKFGPLAPLIGVWEGNVGVDTSRIHGEDKRTEFREEIHFEAMGPVNNGPQELYGLRYRTTAWKLEDGKAFHEELGYWMWDAAQSQVMRSFMVPRIVNVIAGGTVKSDAQSFCLEAECGSETYGVLNNRYLDDSYKTKRYSVEVEIHSDGSFSYFEDTQLWIPIKQEVFHHTDQNTLKKK